ncbi:hypothetical protein [Pontibacillus yanchengensis]|nr:hypothetical protein [Pontibacillus yanchengensis]
MKDNEDRTSLKMTAYWFSIPRTLRRVLFWLVFFVLAVFGWMKLLGN